MGSRHSRIGVVFILTALCACSSKPNATAPASIGERLHQDNSSISEISNTLNADPKTALLSSEVAQLKAEGLIASSDDEKILKAFQK